jgi:acetyl esterase/lipase
VLEHCYGSGDLQYWLYEPDAPKPASAPVVIFNHGWGAMTPGGYRAWIDHIVRRGNIVIYPRYQSALRTPPNTFIPNVIAVVKQALHQLQSESGHVKPQLDKLAVVGHSAGGEISAGLAAHAASAGLPPIKAVMCVQPGKTWGQTAEVPELDDVSAMPASTLLLVLIGDRDNIAKDRDAQRIFSGTVGVPSANKNLVEIFSDDHGSPALVANHFFPAAPAADQQGSDRSTDGSRLNGSLRERIRQRFGLGQANQGGDDPNTTGEADEEPGYQMAGLGENHMHGINALDYYGTWKLFDALEDAAFYGKERDYALGNTPKQRYMGNWSDGVAVKELEIVK